MECIVQSLPICGILQKTVPCLNQPPWSEHCNMFRLNHIVKAFKSKLNFVTEETVINKIIYEQLIIPLNKVLKQKQAHMIMQ